MFLSYNIQMAKETILQHPRPVKAEFLPFIRVNSRRRPDHGAVQIRKPWELQLGREYTWHYVKADGKETPVEISLEFLEYPRIVDYSTFKFADEIRARLIFPSGNVLETAASLSQMNLIPQTVPNYRGELWEQNSWVEDPSRREKFPLLVQLTQREA